MFRKTKKFILTPASSAFAAGGFAAGGFAATGALSSFWAERAYETAE